MFKQEARSRAERTERSEIACKNVQPEGRAWRRAANSQRERARAARPARRGAPMGASKPGRNLEGRKAGNNLEAFRILSCLPAFQIFSWPPGFLLKSYFVAKTCRMTSSIGGSVTLMS